MGKFISKMFRGATSAFDGPGLHRLLPPSRLQDLRRQIEAQYKTQEKDEELKALEKAAAEYRSRIAVSQGRKTNRVVSDERAILNRLGLLG